MTTDIDAIHAELEALPSLQYPLIAFLDFVFALESGYFSKKGPQWVYEPNFVTLSVHSQRAENATLCLRGYPHEFAQSPHLPLSSAQGGYSRCKLKSVLQLDAALTYVRRAHELWAKGASRAKRSQKIVEE